MYPELGKLVMWCGALIMLKVLGVDIGDDVYAGKVAD
jgi:hypothetical protein